MSVYHKCFLMLSGLVLMAGCNPGIPGSGVSKTETRQVGEFRSISHDSIGEVNVQIGPTQNVSVTFDDNLLSLIETKVVDGELQISTSGSFSSKVGMVVDVTVPAVESLRVGGVGAVQAKGIEAESLDLKLTGVGKLTVEGKTKDLNLTVSGVGSADLKGLEAENATVVVSGVGGASVFATKSIDVRTTGVGGVKVYGNPPDPKIKSDGIGKVTIEK